MNRHPVSRHAWAPRLFCRAQQNERSANAGRFAKRMLVLGLALGLGWSGAGCDQSHQATSAKPAPAAAASDPAATVSALENAKAELTRGPEGTITQVTFRDAPATDAAVDSLIGLASLQNLTIVNSELTAAGWAKVGQVKQLRHLDLRDCKLDNQQLKAAVAGLSELVSLRLSGKSGATTVDDDGIVALKNCPNLKVLGADFLWISDVGLAELSGLKALRELYLAGSLVDDAALERIAAIPSVSKLRISKTTVGKEGLEKLVALKLEDLDISECSNLDDAALEPVGKMVSLKKLNLWRAAIGDVGAAHLAPLVNLQWLNVDNTQLSDAGLKSFAGFSKLTFLHLGSTAVSDAGVPDLLGLKSLTELKVTRTSVTEAGVEPLRKAMPKLDIQLKYGEP
ncbi:MAG: hypothetical protein IT423_05615 [Pirellulaceae bacterium]|nr:hypothetical protein [Pirellulaceae bacterium]